MLVKDTAAAELKRIISTLDRILQDSSRFENALYDCFDKPLDVFNLMAGFSYFAPLTKKPKAEAAAAAIAKKSKIGREEARLVSEIWIAARFAGVKDADVTEVAKQKSPQRGAAPVQPSQTIEQDAAATTPKENVTAKRGKTPAAKKPRNPLSLAESVSRIPDTQNVFYAGEKNEAAATKTDKTFFGKLYTLLTGLPRCDTGYYSAAAILVMALVTAFGLGICETAAYFAFRGGNLAFGLSVTPVFYLLCALYFWGGGARALNASGPLFLACVAAVPATLLAMGVYAAARYAVYAFMPAYAFGGWVIAAFAAAFTALAVWRSRPEGRGGFVFATLCPFGAALAGTGVLAASGAICALSYAVDTAPLSLLAVYVVLALAAPLLASVLYRKNGAAYVCAVSAFTVAAFLVTELMAFTGAGFCGRVEWYWSFGAALLTVLAGIGVFAPHLGGSAWTALLKLAGVVAGSLLLLWAFFPLFALMGEDRFLTAGILAVLFTLLLEAAASFLLYRRRHPEKFQRKAKEKKPEKQ